MGFFTKSRKETDNSYVDNGVPLYASYANGKFTLTRSSNDYRTLRTTIVADDSCVVSVLPNGDIELRPFKSVAFPEL